MKLSIPVKITLACILIFGAIGAVRPVFSNAYGSVLIWLMGGLIISHSTLPIFKTQQGHVTVISAQLLISHFIILWTGGIRSSYYAILLVPMLSAAGVFGPVGTCIYWILACLSYLSMLFLVDWTRYVIPEDQGHEIALRLLMLLMTGYLVVLISEANRRVAQQTAVAAKQLAQVNEDLLRSEATTRQAERLAALAYMSAGFAHELRNPMSTIRASAEMLLGRLRTLQDEVGQELASFVVTEADRTNGILTRFLEYAGPFPLNLQNANINDVIDRATSRVERHVRESGVAVYRNYAPDLGPVACDPNCIEEAAYNLILNAVQASQSGGVVTVKTKSHGGSVEIAVIDRGTGIAPGDLPHIFTPFFTRRPAGVGLGLAIVHRCVTEHNGTVTVESELGRGSIFRAFLPRCKDTPLDKSNST